MIPVYNKFVQKYIPEKHKGKNPGFLAFLFNTNSYGKYQKKISELSAELSQFSDVAILIPHLVDNYGLSLNNAREFVNKNVTYRFRRGDSIDKKCMLIHANRNLDNALKNLEGTLGSIRENKK